MTRESRAEPTNDAFRIVLYRICTYLELHLIIFDFTELWTISVRLCIPVVAGSCLSHLRRCRFSRGDSFLHRVSGLCSSQVLIVHSFSLHRLMFLKKFFVIILMFRCQHLECYLYILWSYNFRVLSVYSLRLNDPKSNWNDTTCRLIVITLSPVLI